MPNGPLRVQKLLDSKILLSAKGEQQIRKWVQEYEAAQYAEREAKYDAFRKAREDASRK